MRSDKIVNFGELLKKAWQYVWKFKYLWLLGILTGGGASSGSSNFSLPANSWPNNNDWQNSMTGHNLTDAVPSLGKVLGASGTSLPIVLMLVIALAVFLLLILFIYLSITARGAIISAVNGIDSGKNFSLAESWHYGHKYFWKILGFSILSFLIIFVPLLFLATPVVIMAMLKWYIPAIIVGVLFLIIFVLYAIYIALSIQYGERILVLENKGSWDSIKDGMQFFRNNWKNVLLTYLILIALMIGAGTALVIGLLIVGGSLAAIVYGLYLANQTVAIILAIPLGLILFTALLAANGLIASYQSTLITLVYKEIRASD